MRRLTAFVLAGVMLLSFSGCKKELPVNDPSTGKGDEAVLETPPVLNIQYGEIGTEAMMGTYDWTYSREDGISVGINADSMHPLHAKAYMPVLTLGTGYDASESTLLGFETPPDSVGVRYWSGECWGQPEADADELEASVSGAEGPDREYRLNLKNGNYIYEITAEWSASEKYGGRVYYSFCTVN